MQGEASTRLGFTGYFRVELAWAKLPNVARASPRDEHRCRRETAAGTHFVKLN